MTPPGFVSITVRMPEDWVRSLQALVDPHSGLDDIAVVLAELANHAQQGVYRPSAWERDWLCEAFGYAWLVRVEPDPEHPGIFERPRPSAEDGAR